MRKVVRQAALLSFLREAGQGGPSRRGWTEEQDRRTSATLSPLAEASGWWVNQTTRAGLAPSIRLFSEEANGKVNNCCPLTRSRQTKVSGDRWRSIPCAPSLARRPTFPVLRVQPMCMTARESVPGLTDVTRP